MRNMTWNQENLIINLRHELHQHPELSLQEHWTRQHLMEFLKSHTTLEIVDRGAWFYAVKHALKKGGSDPIAFRADFDALPIAEPGTLPYASACPGVSHKCGHDGHSAALCALALMISEMDVKRDVYLIFQHAEEIGAGGEVCAQLLSEKHIQEVYAFHNLGGFPEGSIVVREGLTQPASKGLTISFYGKTSHASNPEQGRNPAFAVAQLVSFLHEQLELPHQGMVLGTVVNIEVGSKDFGVSAGSGEVSITLRAEEEREMDALEQALREKAELLAAQEKLNVEFAVADPFPETRNDADCLQKVRDVAQAQGRMLIEMPELWRASEDFGYYLKQCKGAMFYIGSGEDYAPLHTVQYDFNDAILPVACEMFLGLI